MSPTPAPHGAWRSPITSSDLLRGALGVAFPRVENDVIYWMESRPGEGGRTAIVRRLADGTIEDCLPTPFNARSRVHEYGGVCYALDGSRLYFVDFSDQRIHVTDLDTPDVSPRPVTRADGRRWADLVVDAGRNRLLAVGEEDREGDEPRNFLAAIELDSPPGGARITELAHGHDFFACPRLSPDGATLVWLTWDHPAMPWDGTTLWRASVAADGSLDAPVAIAGGDEESIFQPEFTPAGELIYVSDASGWWNLYRHTADGAVPLLPREADFGLPLWQFGMRTWAAVDAGRLICTWQAAAGNRLGLLDLASGELEEIDLPWTALSGVVAGNGLIACIGAAPDRSPELIRLDPAGGSHEIVRRSADLALQAGDVSVPEAIDYPSLDGETVHAYFYPPANRSFTGMPGERPPLLVMSHGGPTAATAPVLNLKVQFWTSRGFAVLDVNYRGSTGYGRAYRDRLKGNWGVVDVADCVAGARFLVERGNVDRERLAIRGSSAGGFTTLAALTFHDVFRAGASLYGIGDLEALARDTHKFEARYLDSLVGPWPEAAEVYRARSPIHHVERLECPVIFLQGLEDRIVPPAQAEAMVAALEAKGLPVAYVAFEGEQHGFRQAENIRRALEAELYFYGRVFDFTPADDIEPVPIRNG